MAVKLRERKNADGTTSLFLDIYYNGKRKYEFLNGLKLAKITKSSSPGDRQQNKENYQKAQIISAQRLQELRDNEYDFAGDIGKKVIVTEWMQSYVDEYDKKDKRNLQGALNRFKDFLIQENLQGLTFAKLTEDIIYDYQEYLKEHNKREGVTSYFTRFKKMVKKSVRQKLIKANPAAHVKTFVGKASQKETLTLEEIQLLAKTPTEGPEVKRAFLFSCVTGLRWADVSVLKWSSVNLEGGYLIIEQTKTDREVRINLNSTAKELLGRQGKPETFVFDLPTANGANKTLRLWVKRAGINKHVTWHVARHSFGTNLIYFGTDIVTASSLLGHTSLKHTQRYVRAANALKERATDKLNFNL